MQDAAADFDPAHEADMQSYRPEQLADDVGDDWFEPHDEDEEDRLEAEEDARELDQYYAERDAEFEAGWEAQQLACTALEIGGATMIS